MATPKGQTVLVNDGKPVAALAPVLMAFGDVELMRPDTSNVYDNRGQKSTTAATFSVEIITSAGSFTLAGNVYGRLKDDGTVKFNAALPKGIKAKGDAKDAFDRHVNGAIMAWSGRNRAWSAAHEALTAAPKPKGSKAEKIDDALTYTPPVRGGNIKTAKGEVINGADVEVAEAAIAEAEAEWTQLVGSSEATAS